MNKSQKSLAMRGYEYFEQNYDTLFKQFGRGVYVVRGEQVLAVYNYDDEDVAFEYYITKYPDLDFFALRCNGQHTEPKIIIASCWTQSCLDNL